MTDVALKRVSQLSIGKISITMHSINAYGLSGMSQVSNLGLVGSAPQTIDFPPSLLYNSPHGITGITPIKQREEKVIKTAYYRSISRGLDEHLTLIFLQMLKHVYT